MSTTSQYDFEVMTNEQVAQDVWCMRCHTDLAALLSPGQFVNIQVPGNAAHVLRIPLSFSRTDAKARTLELVFAVVGEGTRRLSAMQAGQTSTMVGPCGKGWQLPTRKGRALLVAGGVGLPPIVACARMLTQAGVGFDAIVGAQTSDKHVDYLLDELRALAPCEGCDCARKVLVTTDDGSRGIRGFTTAAMRNMLAEHAYGTVYTCGPQPMMAGVAKLAASAGSDCQASLERMMGCGFGACSCCNVALASGGYALCCTDGPVFDAKEVAW
ncbi:MAG: dihydroorotate dehydrogenase electron transfer subunit [Atopobiaceae bacterium]|nr:dihydroorotate dehydrogenase electron transfer subunit [Atopobiaceae bacterium]